MYAPSWASSMRTPLGWLLAALFQRPVHLRHPFKARAYLVPPLLRRHGLKDLDRRPQLCRNCFQVRSRLVVVHSIVVVGVGDVHDAEAGHRRVVQVARSLGGASVAERRRAPLLRRRVFPVVVEGLHHCPESLSPG